MKISQRLKHISKELRRLRNDQYYQPQPEPNLERPLKRSKRVFFSDEIENIPIAIKYDLFEILFKYKIGAGRNTIFDIKNLITNKNNLSTHEKETLSKISDTIIKLSDSDLNDYYFYYQSRLKHEKDDTFSSDMVGPDVDVSLNQLNDVWSDDEKHQESEDDFDYLDELFNKDSMLSKKDIRQLEKDGYMRCMRHLNKTLDELEGHLSTLL